MLEALPDITSHTNLSKLLLRNNPLDADTSNQLLQALLEAPALIEVDLSETTSPDTQGKLQVLQSALETRRLGADDTVQSMRFGAPSPSPKSAAWGQARGRALFAARQVCKVWTWCSVI